MGFDSSGFKINLLDAGEKIAEESSLVNFSGDANIPTAGHLLPQYQTNKSLVNSVATQMTVLTLE